MRLKIINVYYDINTSMDTDVIIFGVTIGKDKIVGVRYWHDDFLDSDEYELIGENGKYVANMVNHRDVYIDYELSESDEEEIINYVKANNNSKYLSVYLNDYYFVCQLGHGLMLASPKSLDEADKHLNVLWIVNTGYPYPDTFLDNMEMFQYFINHMKNASYSLDFCYKIYQNVKEILLDRVTKDILFNGVLTTEIQFDIIDRVIENELSRM